MLVVLISNLVCVLFGYLYPVYATYKALKRCDPGETKQWLMYWVVMSGFAVAETIGEMVLTILPFYYEVKTLFVLWLVLPQTQGATVIYNAYVEKYLAQHEREIDRIAFDTRQRWRQTVSRAGGRTPRRASPFETATTGSTLEPSETEYRVTAGPSLVDRTSGGALGHVQTARDASRAIGHNSGAGLAVSGELSSALNSARVGAAL
ncbi:hypothetical protein CCYA_CCYA07G2222 [Cyanidiococcus yangmingshanensis]|nr:hypothetical protein CCYA_CCYA07G2222 [Cyanidiococcus yangmingshanensis]